MEDEWIIFTIATKKTLNIYIFRQAFQFDSYSDKLYLMLIMFPVSSS